MQIGFLERYHDSALDLSAIPGREALEAGEVARICRALAVALVAGGIPRRLGSDANDEELALDKRRARRTAHALRNSLTGWVKKLPDLPLDDEIKQQGAQLNWETFRDAHVAELQTRLRVLATWAIRSNEQRWGRSAIVNLENEMNWFTYALRD